MLPTKSVFSHIDSLCRGIRQNQYLHIDPQGFFLEDALSLRKAPSCFEKLLFIIRDCLFRDTLSEKVSIRPLRQLLIDVKNELDQSHIKEVDKKLTVIFENFLINHPFISTKRYFKLWHEARLFSHLNRVFYEHLKNIPHIDAVFLYDEKLSSPFYYSLIMRLPITFSSILKRITNSELKYYLEKPELFNPLFLILFHRDEKISKELILRTPNEYLMNPRFLQLVVTYERLDVLKLLIQILQDDFDELIRDPSLTIDGNNIFHQVFGFSNGAIVLFFSKIVSFNDPLLYERNANGKTPIDLCKDETIKINLESQCFQAGEVTLV